METGSNSDRRGELFHGLLRVLADYDEALQVGDAFKALAKLVPPTDFEQGFYPTGVRRFGTLVRFDAIRAIKAGWVTQHPGRWEITNEGRAALLAHTTAEALYRESKRLYGQWRAARSPLPDEVDDGSLAENSSSVVAFEVAQDQSWAQIEQHVASILPYEFQNLVASLLRAMGYCVNWVSPRGKDGGVDILAFTDPLGVQAPRVRVAVRRQADTRTPVDALRSFMALLGREEAGIFVSTGGFTRDAEQEARRQKDLKITLISLPDLVALWIEYYGKLDDGAKSQLPLRPIYFLVSTGA